MFLPEQVCREPVSDLNSDPVLGLADKNTATEAQKNRAESDLNQVCLGKSAPTPGFQNSLFQVSWDLKQTCFRPDLVRILEMSLKTG